MGRCDALNLFMMIALKELSTIGMRGKKHAKHPQFRHKYSHYCRIGQTSIQKRRISRHDNTATSIYAPRVLFAVVGIDMQTQS